MNIVINQNTYSTIKGKTLLDVCLQNDVAIKHECEGKGTCGTCAVEVLNNGHLLSLMTPSEKAILDAAPKLGVCRLACQSIVLGPVEVTTHVRGA